MGQTEGDYKLGSLGADFLEKIIKTRAFSSNQEEEWPGELVNMVGEVAKRCAGSPLAATALGSVLRTKTSKKQWEAVINRSTVCGEENGILQVLNLSYNCLPSYMRQCFAFCAMFPKDHEIDVQMLIHLWMANGFIPEQPQVCLETIGENIFNELKSRSFFQDLKSVPFDKERYIFGGTNKHMYCSRITCKIHDLTHDVAQSAMGKECAAISTRPSESEDILHLARHLYLSVPEPETLLNASLDKGSQAFQTLLICDVYVREDMKILSKYNSIRALKINRLGPFLIRPKYLHHLRYLDLSKSDIEAFPKDISILYHLQILNLSHCKHLERLPKGLKYLTALRHLYTHGCGKLKSMPAQLRHLTSLQTLTYFVAGTKSGCSNVGELQNLDLGGKLELSQLENVTGADAHAAGLSNKEKLTELMLRWTDGDQEAPNNKHNHKEVVEGLKPHDGLKVLQMYSCGSSTFPTWMITLRGMVELQLWDCNKLEKLPALWELPALKILLLQGLESLHCLCNGGTTPVTFQKLKVITLSKLSNFQSWWDTDELQGEKLTFPEVEELEINECGSLTALPKAASVIMESSGGVDTKCRSAFPALRKMVLYKLTFLDRWEAVEGTLGEEVTFPRLEELYIRSCGSLSALPKGSLLVEQSFGRAETVCRRSAFPSLRNLDLSGLPTLERWGAVEGTPREVAFPLLEDLRIRGCPKLTDLPEAPKLSELCIEGDDQQISLQAASRYIPSLSRLTLDVSTHGRFTKLCDTKRSIRKVHLPAMWSKCCNILFSSHSSTQAPWTCFAQLVDLEIWDCDSLVCWPENVFQVLVCLRNLSIAGCSKLTGRTQASDEQSAPAPERGGLLPRLKYLEIEECASLVEIPNLPASLKTLCIGRCSYNVRSIVFGQQEDMRLVSGGVVCTDTPSSIPGSAVVLKLSSATNHHILPCLQSLQIRWCAGLSEVANLPPSIKTLDISDCYNLQSLSGQLDAVQKLTIRYCSRLESLEESWLGELQSLQELNLYECESLASLPDGPQAYSSLRVLKITNCDGVKLLPPNLQRRFDYLEKKDLDAHLEEPKTRKCSIRSLVCLK
ncbi:unnamed protein product [Urochloa decumbens]|uniref:NB-ARC domain-containing protein n=1 Tax=Urochloa decumbens TaxID=240449 RepID=A0ABC9FN03_9POAL